MCKTAPAKPHRPWEEPGEDAAHAVSPVVASTSPLTKSSISLASTLSAAPAPVQSNLKTIPLSIAPESSSGLASSLPAVSGLVRTSRPFSALSWWWATARALFFPGSTHHKSQQEHLSHHPKEASFWGGPASKHVEIGGPCFLSPDVLKLLEVQVMKRAELKVLKEKEREALFRKQISTDYHLNSLGTMLKSLGDEQGTPAPQPFWSTKEKPEQLLSAQQLSYPQALREHLHCRCSQLFWGLPSLHSESLVATAWVSGRSSPNYSPSVLFNRHCEARPAKMQPKPSPLFLQPQVSPHTMAQPQALTPTMSQSQPPPTAEVQIQDTLQSPLPILPSSPSLVGDSGVSYPTCQDEAQSPIPTGEQHLEWPSKNLKRGKGRSQEATGSLTISLDQGCQASQVPRSVQSIPRSFPSSDNLQKQIEQHLQKRLIVDHWNLPYMIQESLRLMQTREKLPKTCLAKKQPGPSQPSAVTGQSSKEAKKMGSKHPESNYARGPAKFQLKKDLGKGMGQINPSKRSESSQVKRLGTNSKEEAKCELPRHLKSEPGNNLTRASERRQIENALKVHLGRKLGQIIEGKIPVSVRRSWFSVSHTLPKSNSQTEIRNLASSKNRKFCMNTSQELSFLEPSTQEMLEAHIIRCRVRQKWGLPLQILELGEAQVLPPQPTFPVSPTQTTGTHIAEAGELLGENPLLCQEEKVVTAKSNASLESLLPVPNPAGEEIQRVLVQTPPGHSHGHSGAPLTGQEGRQPPQPLASGITGRPQESGAGLGAPRGSPEPTPCQATTENEQSKESGGHTRKIPSPSGEMLEMDAGSRTSRSEESREASQADQRPALQPRHVDILRTSELESGQILSVDLNGLGAPGTSKSRPHPRMASAESPEAQVASKFQLKGEAEQQSHLQNCPPDVLPQERPFDTVLRDWADDVVLQDCATDALLQGYPTDKLFATGNLSNPLSQGHPQNMPTAATSASQVLSDFLLATESCLGPQDFRILKPQAPQKSQGKAGTPTEDDFRVPKSEEQWEGFSGLGSSQAGRMNQRAHARELIDTLEKEFLQVLPEEEKPSLEKHFKRTRQFLQYLYSNKNIKELEDSRQKDKPELASAWSQGPAKSKPLVSAEVEVQALTAAVRQILVEKLNLRASELGQRQEEAQVPGGRLSCDCRVPLYSEPRRELRAVMRPPQGARASTAEANVAWTRAPGAPQLAPPGSLYLQSAPTSIVSRTPGVSSHARYYPRCSLQKIALSDPPENASRVFPGKKICFQEKCQR
ncbi:spermatogenesis-associated protein 31A6-like [Dasypus novemcinctus]|uniref:spermatogenesis-associated protein 31A6-like n=1 Tax=Dasypus novemcinctus TaxID=9361 RepID=UPI00265DB85F|nr:spermatogenesis-associated protein 31A6-like [Dasypus novemcinctus]